MDKHGAAGEEAQWQLPAVRRSFDVEQEGVLLGCAVHSPDGVGLVGDVRHCESLGM